MRTEDVAATGLHVCDFNHLYIELINGFVFLLSLFLWHQHRLSLWLFAHLGDLQAHSLCFDYVFYPLSWFLTSPLLPNWFFLYFNLSSSCPSFILLSLVAMQTSPPSPSSCLRLSHPCRINGFTFSCHLHLSPHHPAGNSYNTRDTVCKWIKDILKSNTIYQSAVCSLISIAGIPPCK